MRQIWTYTARDSDGRQVKGRIEAENEAQAGRAVMQQDLIPVRIRRHRDKFSPSEILGHLGSGNRERLILFTQKLRALYKAGIPLLRALSIIESSAGELNMQSEISGIKHAVASGSPLSLALSQFPRKFPPLYIASISAGESSGKLDDVLNQLATLIEKEMVLHRQLRSALQYPLIVLGAIVAAVVILMTFVIPRFMTFYGKFDAELPLATRVVIAASTFFSSYWYVVLGILIVLLFVLRNYLATDSGRLKADKFILRLPVFGDMVLKVNVARFSALLKILTSSGLPIITCMRIVQQTTPNKAIVEDLKRLTDSFERGQEVGNRLRDYQYLPSMSLEMLQIGLESGAIDQVMGQLAEHYEMEVDYRTRHLTALLGPILTVLIGGMVLLLALSVFLPMWNLIRIFR